VRLERGFRRLTFVLSALALGIGITGSIISLRSYGPGATVRVALGDGHVIVLEGAEGTDYVADRTALDRELFARPELWVKRQDPTYGETKVLAPVVDVRVVRRTEYWWWKQTWLMRATVVFVALLWVAFYLIRWIAKGFTGNYSKPGR
jgi:hypothetical protein